MTRRKKRGTRRAETTKSEARRTRRPAADRRRSRTERATPLPWSDPPFDVVARICREARIAVAPEKFRRARDCSEDSDVLARQAILRTVGRELHRRLFAAGILVEGPREDDGSGDDR